MGLFDDVSQKITEAADFTIKEAEKLGSLAKIKYNLMTLRGDLDKIYKNIGVLKYDEYKNGSDNTSQLNEACTQADQLKEELELLEAQCADAQNYKLCKVCHEKMDKESTYCPKCGAKQTDEN